MGGCDNNGNLHEEKFSAPMPWIGMYVAAASLACLLAMAADVIYSFRHCKFWFPSKFFSINATTLTLLGVAIKLSVDLNTPMPNRHDQLAKLSSSVFICTAMANSMPSLGAMENEEMFMNVAALGILVITLTVNICIQIATGAIFVFVKEHTSIVFIMIVLLVMTIFSALTVPTTKSYLEKMYNKRYNLALKESSSEIRDVGKLRDALTKHWVMAHTSSPQFVLARSVICTASGAFCLLATMILAEAMVRAYFMAASFTFCMGQSDYKLTTTLILFTQAIAVGVGTITPSFRWFLAINFKCPIKGNINFKKEFETERYWTQGLLKLKKEPVPFRFQNRFCRKLAHEARNVFLDFCIGMQKCIVLSSKVIRCISILLIFCFYDFFIQWKTKKFDLNTTPQSEQTRRQDFSRYVLFLEGENALVEFMMRTNCDATERWFEKGKKEAPLYLLNLLEKSTASQGFKGTANFDNDQVPSLYSEEPPYCWALPVVTLTSIALALPNINTSSMERLIHGVNQGMICINAIENHLDCRGDLANIRKAANNVWLRVDLYHKWLDVDLKKLSLPGKSPKEVLQELAETAKSRFDESIRKHMAKNQCSVDRGPSKWSAKEFAANSMHRICQTLLLNQTCDDRLFEEVVVMISDIVGACLTNIQHVVASKCFYSKIEEREETVRHAVRVLGKTERILKIVDKGIPPGFDSHQMGCISEWRLSHKQKMNPAAFSSLPSDPECDGSPLLVQVAST